MRSRSLASLPGRLAAAVVGALRRRPTLAPSGPRAQAVLASALVLLAGGSGTKLALHRMDALPAGAAFRASGTVVTVGQLQRRVTLMEFLYGLQQPADAHRLDLFKRSVAKAVAVSGIVAKAARARNIVIADKEASDQLDKLIQDNSWKDRPTFDRTLSARGLAERDVLDEIERQQANARLFAQVTKPAKTSTDADAQRYYDAHKAQMLSPEQRSIDNIVVSSSAEAQQILGEARSGTAFGTLAREYSIDGSTRDKGGSLGAVSAADLDSGYAKVAFQAKKGAVFGPVQTPQGWNVGRVTNVHAAVPLTFAQVKSAVRTKLDNDAKVALWNAFLVKRIKAAHVAYAPAYRPADPDAPPRTN